MGDDLKTVGDQAGFSMAMQQNTVTVVAGTDGDDEVFKDEGCAKSIYR